ncbi:hypothetical protein RAJCM14343_0903 [Rhodococcus aetherivorans]|jgi:hypothetical protein|uniref:DUF6191 domain-containing protein n=1 Tax=Rhodococcus aetherivorans TaxID=191292 RepID=A0A059MU08_9NOCA|nr:MULTISPECIES: DUF6191 domain-containing protein [Rhodococcus]ETT28239.1 hypothetical protein RR21198_1150 [Rhodococcus rhodochrous ATCC 21198]MDF2711724.1 hypothetical protein [Nonomuraea muscovyensis]ANZ26869.1 hypothetical protein A4U64_20870 [Rhodococcus sp. WB1]KDE14628.1 hypothetical protein N505_0100575 [Rhodococcus aetherivorans]MBC2591920.1 hypothetical protein [Rhodococcus aetherivorans]
MGALFAMTIPGLACLLVGAAAVEVLWSRLTGHRLLRRSGDGRTRPVAATGFEEVGAVFEGSRRFEFEQRQTSLMDREDATGGEPGWLSVETRWGRMSHCVDRIDAM